MLFGIVGGVSAQEDPGTLIYEYDYSDKADHTFWKGGFPDGASISIDDNALTVVNPSAVGSWQCQYFVADNVPTKVHGSYVIRFHIKGSVAGTTDCNVGNWTETLSRKVNFTTEWQNVDIACRGICAGSYVMFQSGAFAGTIQLKKVQVFEIVKNQEIGDKIHECDYSTKTEHTFWKGSLGEGSSITVNEGILTVVNSTKKGNWEQQYFVDDAISTINGKDYVMRVTIKGSDSGSLDCQMGDWSNTSARKLFFTDEWQTLDIWFYGVPATSSHITFQSGGFVGTLEIRKVEVLAVDDIEVVLVDGFKELTLDMCRSWDSPNAGANATGYAGEINLNSPRTGGAVVYGGNVPWSVYADLTGYSKLVVTGTPGFPVRILYNREKKDDGTDGTVQEIIQGLNEKGYYEFSLLSWGAYAHLNSIKKQGWDETPSGVINELLLLGNDVSLDYVKISDAGYATYCATSNVNLFKVKGYAAKYEGGCVKLTAVTNVPADEAVIVKATEGTYGLPVIASADAITDNDLLISDGSVTGNGEIYILANKSNGVGFYKLAVGSVLPAGKAYLQIPAGSPAPEFIGFGFNMDTTTGVNNVETVKKAANVIYNLNGQRVNKTAKGLYIVNGKKVAIK